MMPAIIVAISLLFSFVNPQTENTVARALEQLGVPLSISHQILPEFREYERTSTVVVNAYLQPVMQRYLENLNRRARSRIFVMQSSGGITALSSAAREPVRTVLSGPAGGVVGAAAMARRSGFDRIISFDMGGTSTDVALVDCAARASNQAEIAGFPIGVPMLDIHTVGAGGGSIARFDAGGALRVGPESAGADPGPICYGRGTQPTVTDANLVLGRLGADRFLGGEMKLDLDAAKKALTEKIAKPLGLDPIEAAEGILRIATTKMAHVVRWVTTERGLDAAEFSLVAYGGAGPLHAAMVARELRIAQVVIPRAPGHFSAYGMLVADLRRDFVNTWFTPLAEASFSTIENFYAEMETRGREAVQRSGIAVAGMSVQRAADMRYVGQEHAVTVELPVELFRTEDREGIKRRFDGVHETRYGYSAPAEKAEIVSLRTAITGLMRKPTFEPIAVGEAMPPPAAFRGTREVYFAEAGRAVDTPTYDRAALLANNRIAGPVLIEEYASTTVVHPGDVVVVDAFGDLVIEILRS
jgi:N-methylhydantoinase A